MPDLHAPHPAIRRGFFERDDLRALWVCTDPVVGRRLTGGAPFRVAGPMPVVNRVVLAGHDMMPYIAAVPVSELPGDLSSPTFIRIIAGYLREGLIDPGTEWVKRSPAPVVAVKTDYGLGFVQAIACLN